VPGPWRLNSCAMACRKARSTSRGWATNREGFSPKYTRAREIQAMSIADELLEIADDARNDWMQRPGRSDDDPGWQLNSEHVQRSRVRIDTRKWLLSKMLPKVYGDKTEVAVTGADRGPVQSVTCRTQRVRATHAASSDRVGRSRTLNTPTTARDMDLHRRTGRSVPLRAMIVGGDVNFIGRRC
jgi:hypothetical protein